jgi:hypothetical protein
VLPRNGLTYYLHTSPTTVISLVIFEYLLPTPHPVVTLVTHPVLSLAHSLSIATSRSPPPPTPLPAASPPAPAPFHVPHSFTPILLSSVYLDLVVMVIISS